MSDRLPSVLLGLLLSALRGRPSSALTVLLYDIDLILILPVGVFAFWLVDKLVYHTGPSRLLKLFVILLCGQALLGIVPVPLPVTRPRNDTSDKQVHHISTPWLIRDWAYLAVGVLLIVSPLLLLAIAIGQFISAPYLFDIEIMAYEYWRSFSATVISFFVGTNRFKQWVRNPLFDLCGCFVAFLLCALAALPELIAVGDNLFIQGGAPLLEQSLKASILSFYTVLNLIGAIQASRRIRNESEE